MRGRYHFRLFASFLLIVLFASPSFTWALTTFGKTNSQNQNQNPPPPPTSAGKARECKMESDCAGIQNTTCMADPRNGRTQCLCGDYSVPRNGACVNKYKALRAPCNEDTECIENAHCVQRNSTSSGKRCYCLDDYYEESPLICSGSSSIVATCTTIFLFASVLLGSFNYP
ncbi:hypothetical protein KM043_006615 [Ampulex compressa]|nr:hypothetical protein KM043_006615 [Ampulex compressa]